VSNCINALLNIAVLSSASLVTVMSGGYYKPDEDVLANGPTVLACFAELLEAVFAGSGTLRTMFGLRCIQTTKSDGFMWMLVRKHGITLASMLRVGARRCPTALHSPLMALLMSLDDTCARTSMLLSVTDALKRFFSMLCKRLRTCADPT
jgi:hypothetical protein